MADRIFGTVILLVTLAYGFVAFTVIEAPFQYDPLGPESWPRILAVCAGLCALYVMIRPDDLKFNVANNVLTRIGIVVVMLAAYAHFYEPAGFIVATTIFCAVFSKLFGASYKESVLFGIGTGVLGYILCALLLDLNLPKGILEAIL